MTDPNPERSTSVQRHPLLIGQLLTTALATAPNQEIVYRGEHRFRYREFGARIGRLASVLAGHGVRPGDTVAVMDWDSHRYLECYFAIPMMGAVLQTVNVRLSLNHIIYTLNHAGATTLLVHAELLPLVRAMRKKLTAVRTFILIADEATASVTELPMEFAGEYEALLAKADPSFRFGDFDENTRATAFYTTGTTGQPKGVCFTHRQIVLHTLSVAAALAGNGEAQSFNRGDVYMPLTPMFHAHAWGLPYIATMFGAKQVYPGRYLPERLLELIRTEKVTFSHCVATILHMLLNHPAAVGVDLQHWKVAIGGGPLPVGLARQAIAHGIDVFGGYGMSETGPVISLAQVPPADRPGASQDELRVRCTAGAPVPLVDIRVVDVAMRDVPRDGHRTGEVVIRAPWLTDAYLNDELASAKLWTGGYLHTQDVGRFDRNGNLIITDRLKDVIKSGGEWVSSIELEGLLSLHPDVSEAAVIGIHDEKWGERPFGFVVLRTGGRTTEAELIAHLRKFEQDGALSKFAMPSRIMLADKIDKTSVGKVDKKKLRERYPHYKAIDSSKGR